MASGNDLPGALREQRKDTHTHSHMHMHIHRPMSRKAGFVWAVLALRENTNRYNTVQKLSTFALHICIEEAVHAVQLISVGGLQRGAAQTAVRGGSLWLTVFIHPGESFINTKLGPEGLCQSLEAPGS